MFVLQSLSVHGLLEFSWWHCPITSCHRDAVRSPFFLTWVELYSTLSSTCVQSHVLPAKADVTAVACFHKSNSNTCIKLTCPRVKLRKPQKKKLSGLENLLRINEERDGGLLRYRGGHVAYFPAGDSLRSCEWGSKFFKKLWFFVGGKYNIPPSISGAKSLRQRAFSACFSPTGFHAAIFSLWFSFCYVRRTSERGTTRSTNPPFRSKHESNGPVGWPYHNHKFYERIFSTPVIFKATTKLFGSLGCSYDKNSSSFGVQFLFFFFCFFLVRLFSPHFYFHFYFQFCFRCKFSFHEKRHSSQVWQGLIFLDQSQFFARHSNRSMRLLHFV